MTPVPNRRRMACALFVAIVAVSTFAACGNDSEVGSGVDTEFDQKVGDRLGAATTTTAPTATTGAVTSTTKPAAAAVQTTVKAGAAQAPVTSTTAATTNTAAPTTTVATVTTQDVALDGVGFEFNPIRVFSGTPLRFINKDSQSRSVQGTMGEFDSGPIAPGADFTIVLRTPGDIQIEDGTRPFVTSKIEVRNRR